MRYRPDIDGLRALAVVPVVLAHARVPGFAGGFVGVDVFFVISGYLIAGIIAEEMKAGTFSLRSFYERRVRRILPPLLLVLAATFIAGWVLLMPDDFRLLVRSMLAVITLASNVVFWHEVSYFAPDAAEVPLLHTWSLAVEEQFYLLFPLLIMAVASWSPASRRRLFVIVFLASFAAAAALAFLAPATAFYITPFRAWELLAGAALAGRELPAARLSRTHLNTLQVAGLGLILCPVVSYSEATPFPGLAALPPVAGAAILIALGANGQGVISQLLTKQPLVYLGKISYSLYLWHFPLLAFATYWHLGVLPPSAALSCVAAAMALAVLSYEGLEKRVRDRGRTPAALVVTSIAAASLTLGALCTWVDLHRGAPDRFNGAEMAAVNAARDFNADRESCFMRSASEVSLQAACRMGSQGAPASFVLWGDSHAEVLRTGLDQAARERALEGRYLGSDGCAPIVGVERTGYAHCAEVNRAIAETIIAARDVDTVILAGRWGTWMLGWRYGHETGAPVKIKSASRDVVAGSADGRTQLAVVSEGLERTISLLQDAGKKVVLVGPVPEIGYDVPRAMFLAAIGGAVIEEGLDLDAFMARSAPVLGAIERIAARKGITVIYPHDRLCGSRLCRTVVDGESLYHDDDHLSRRGSALLHAALGKSFGARQMVAGEPAERLTHR